MITAIIMTYADEATGVVLAAEEAGMPAAISFTVETDGRLPSGQALGDAIDEVDDRTGGCCGTDHRHVGEMSQAWLMGAAPAPE